MSTLPGDSSIKCQHAMQIKCGLTGTFKQHLPCASNCHLHLRSTSAAMRFDRPSWLNPSRSQSNGDHKPFWSFICTDSTLLFRFSTYIWAALWKAETFFLGNSFPTRIQPLTPTNSLNTSHPRSQRGTGGLCAVLHEACLLFTFALISCSLSHHGAGDPRQHSRYLGEQCWVFRISVYTEKTFRSAFSSPRFQTQSLVGKKRGIRWSPIFCRLNQISTIELLREWTSGVRGECS